MNNINDQDTTDEKNETTQPRQLSRREALTIVGKHAIYTTPAVIAILSLSSKSARAGSF